MPERSNGAVLKTVNGFAVVRGFESHPRRSKPSPLQGKAPPSRGSHSRRWQRGGYFCLDFCPNSLASSSALLLTERLAGEVDVALRRLDKKMADSPLNVYLRSLKAILADAERELPPRSWRSLTKILAIAVKPRKA